MTASTWAGSIDYATYTQNITGPSTDAWQDFSASPACSDDSTVDSWEDLVDDPSVPAAADDSAVDSWEDLVDDPSVPAAADDATEIAASTDFSSVGSFSPTFAINIDHAHWSPPSPLPFPSLADIFRCSTATTSPSPSISEPSSKDFRRVSPSSEHSVLSVEWPENNPLWESAAADAPPPLEFLAKPVLTPPSPSLDAGNTTFEWQLSALRPRVLYQVAKPQKYKKKLVLVGDIRTCVLPQDSQYGNLADNLLLARKVNSYVHKTVYLSSNYPNRFYSCRRTQRSIENDLDYVRRARNLKEIHRRAVKTHVGNCGEMSSYGLTCPAIGSTNAEQFTIENGDHLFIVLGRDPGTDITLPHTWNADASIADPWSDAYYPASDYRHYLYNYIDIMRCPELTHYSSNSNVPIVEPLQAKHFLSRRRNKTSRDFL